MMTAPYEADLDPATGAPRIRLNFANGWTASMVLTDRSANGCHAFGSSLAAWPTGRCGRGLGELGPRDATAEEAAAWLVLIAGRDGAPQ